MRVLFVLFVFIPSICSAGNWINSELPWTGRGCDSFFETSCYDDYDLDVRFIWNLSADMEEEVRTVYVLEMRLYEKGYLLTEPLHWLDDEHPDQWNRKYLPIVDDVASPEID